MQYINSLAPIAVKILFAKPQRFLKPLRFSKKIETESGKYIYKYAGFVALKNFI